MFRELSARAARRRWARDMHRRLAELDRLDRRHGLGTLPTAATRRRPRSGNGGLWPSILVTAVVLAAVLLLTPTAAGHQVRALFGLGDHRLSSVVSASGTGPFRFEMTQPGTKEPVSYNPCQAIQYVVNPSGAPSGYEELVEEAVASVAEATGFKFNYLGTTEDRTFERRGTMTTVPPPVLIGWATPDEVPELAGRVAGLGGSTAVQRTPHHLTYVTGIVALDRDSFHEMGSRPGGFEEERAILMHELGHVVGLAHVKDDNELMYDDNVGRTTFGPGDLEGLARLGAVPCL